jgi:hypothetical protein
MYRRRLFISLIAIVLLVAAVQWSRSAFLPPAPSPLVKPHYLEGAPLCPWRRPEADMRGFFPGATRYHSDVLVLSRNLVELKRRLGHWPTPDENPLYVHRIYQARQPLGAVLVRRVKGEYGAIEIVLALDTSARIVAMRLQRQREPEPIANALQSPGWLHAFRGRTVNSSWQLGQAVPAVAPVATTSACAVVDGVRSLLILYDVANGHKG